jgi:hypothetical protein
VSGSVPSIAAGVRPQALAYGFAVASGVVLAMFLLRIPVQLTDSFTEFPIMQGRSLWEVMRPEFLGGPYMRPFRRGLIKIVFEWSRGDYSPWFRGFHAIQLIALFLLVIRMMRVRSMADASVIPLALAMIAGAQTFADVVREAFPINHFLTILLCCVAAVNLAQSQGGKLVDATAVALTIFSMFTIESGLLVWVVFAAAYVVGWRGISTGALIAITVVFIGYFMFRFARGGVPGFDERVTGFGFGIADPAELERFFGGRLWPFYFYNIVSAICCVLFAEPRGGTWLFARGLVHDGLLPWQLLTVATSTLATVLVAWHVARRAARWRRRHFDDSDRLILLFLVLLPANALFAAVYEKDVILSPAGLFSAMATAAALRSLLFEDRAWLSSSGRRAIVGSAIIALSVGWTLRSVGIDYRLREMAWTGRNEWAYHEQWMDRQKIHLTDAQRRIEQTLYDDAIWRRPSPPTVTWRFADRLFDPLQ